MEILLQEYNAKLSDFGLAKAGPQGDKTHVSTRVVGTYGYAAPEYVMTGMEAVISSSDQTLLKLSLVQLEKQVLLPIQKRKSTS